MAKRVIDGEGVWRSDKLGRVEPEWVRAEYANLIPLALANGVFEANPRRVWSQVYSYNRPEIDLEDVEMILGAFKKVGLLFSWLDPSGKIWGFWVGIEKSGRLPPPSRLKQRHEVVGPYPPAEELQKYIESTNGSQRLASGCPGFGFGSGSGSGLGSEENLLSEEKGSSDQRDASKKSEKKTEPKGSQPSEAARRLAQLLLTRVVENFRRLEVNSKLLESEREQRVSVKRWAPDIDLMLRRDRYSEAQVRELIEWCQADDFWFTNIRSGYKLRKHAVELTVKMRSEQTKRSGSDRPLDQEYEELEQRRAGIKAN